MKKSRTCPKCGCRKILYVVNVPDRHRDSLNYNSPAMIALIKKGKIRGYAAGELEAYVCSACGCCEHYVKNPESLPVDGDTIRELNN